VYTRKGDRSRYSIVEVEHFVIKYKQYLPAEVLPDGTVREHDIVQFWADPGGLRTVYAKDLVL
jgi:hypothetical protein